MLRADAEDDAVAAENVVHGEAGIDTVVRADDGLPQEVEGELPLK